MMHSSLRAAFLSSLLIWASCPTQLHADVEDDEAMAGYIVFALAASTNILSRMGDVVGDRIPIVKNYLNYQELNFLSHVFVALKSIPWFTGLQTNRLALRVPLAVSIWKFMFSDTYAKGLKKMPFVGPILLQYRNDTDGSMATTRIVEFLILYTFMDAVCRKVLINPVKRLWTTHPVRA